MARKQLEFRGINLAHLGMYFEELGADKMSDSFPYRYSNEKWSAEIVNEDIIEFTPNFKVNAVKILFTADSEDILNELISAFRFKTIRVGG